MLSNVITDKRIKQETTVPSPPVKKPVGGEVIEHHKAEKKETAEEMCDRLNYELFGDCG